MKRCEKLTKEEIIAYFRNINKGCDGCIVYEIKGRYHNCDNCISEIDKVLNEEIEMVPRAWTFGTVEEAMSVRNTFKSNHCEKIKCHDCKYLSVNSRCGCVFQWLYELVEKPKEEEKI